MGKGVEVGQRRALRRQEVPIRRLGRADDLAVAVIFLDDHEYVVEAWRRPWSPVGEGLGVGVGLGVGAGPPGAGRRAAIQATHSRPELIDQVREPVAPAAASSWSATSCRLPPTSQASVMPTGDESTIDVELELMPRQPTSMAPAVVVVRPGTTAVVADGAARAGGRTSSGVV